MPVLRSLMASRLPSSFFQKKTARVMGAIPLGDVEETLRCSGLVKPGGSWMDFLIQNKMAEPNETMASVWERISVCIAQAGRAYDGKYKTMALETAFHDALSSFKFIPSTPIYTNAGRHVGKSLSACAVPPVNFRTMSANALREMIQHYHVKGMGTGFNFDDAPDPAGMLKLLNQFALDEVQDAMIERPVGNMGILSVDHPKVIDFIRAKRDSSVNEWKFNISINLNDAFMEAVKKKVPYKNAHGEWCNPEAILYEAAECARLTGDPGIVFMARYEHSNKTPQLGYYLSLAPCGEVPLFKGEVCQFGYVNLYACMQGQQINYDALRRVVHLAVHFLDNALDYSLARLEISESVNLVSRIRKIGVGLCGFSDVLMAMGIPYDSADAIVLAKNVMSFINYESKCASVKLAKERGPFPAFHDEQTKRDRIVAPFLNHPTETVSVKDWSRLSAAIQQFGIRHVSTAILPPTGRSALVGGASTSIEPYFRLYPDPKLIRSLNVHARAFGVADKLDEIKESIHATGRMPIAGLPAAFRAIYATCLEITPDAHLNMVAGFQQFTDEAISKTVNVPAGTSTEAIVSLFKQAHALPLKGVTVYVDGSRGECQPKPLATASIPGMSR